MRRHPSSRCNIYLVPVASCSPLKLGASHRICRFFCCRPVTGFTQKNGVRNKKDRTGGTDVKLKGNCLHTVCAVILGPQRKPEGNKTNDVCLTRHLFSFLLFPSAPLSSFLLFRGVFAVRNERRFNARLNSSRNRPPPGQRRPLRRPVMAVLVLVSTGFHGCK